MRLQSGDCFERFTFASGPAERDRDSYDAVHRIGITESGLSSQALSHRL